MEPFTGILITGVISGFIASVIFYVFMLIAKIILMSVKPNIRISDELCLESEGDNKILRVKVLNKTRFVLTNVTYTLCFYERIDENAYSVSEILPCKPPLTTIERYSSKDKMGNYAIRFTYKLEPDIEHLTNSENNRLEFTIYANHGFSNTCVCTKKTYTKENISVNRRFESFKSMSTYEIPTSVVNESYKKEKQMMS